MRKIALATLALAGLGSALVTSPSFAAVDDPGPGLICQFASIEDPTAEPGTQSGQLSGGPLVITDSTSGLPGSGTLTCRVQVNQPTYAGTGPSVSGHGTGVVTAGPATITYAAGTEDFVYLCGSFTDDSDGTTYYWDDANGAWATDPATKCGPAFGNPDNDPLQPVWDAIHPIELLIDELICPTLATLFPPDGDIEGIWNCPPYDS